MKTSILTAAENIKRNESLTINFESETTKGFVSIDTFCGNGETYVQIRKTNKFTNNIDLLEKFLKTKKGTINYLKKNI